MKSRIFTIYVLLIILSALFLSSKVYCEDYYWVGGAGNWSDPTHWSNTDGGTGGYGVPGSNDNVYFNTNSGLTASSNSVTVNVATAYCKNMDWTDAPNYPTFTTDNSNNNLNISGSLTLIPGMSWNFSGAIYFTSSTTGQTITTAGQKLLSNVYFNSTGGEWILQDDFEMSMYNYLYHEYGTLNTNGKSLTTYCYYSNSSNPRSLILGSSVVSILSYSSDAFYVRLNNMVIDAGTSLISFTATDYEPGFYLNSGSAPVTFHNVEFVGSSNTGKINNNTYNEVTFNEVSFAGHGTINGNNKYNGNLTFAGGKTYTLQANKTQTLMGDFIANGTCGNEVIIKSSSTTQAILSKSSDSVTINYANLQNINATGGAIFTANGSIDGGGVTGWTITPPASSGADMYWIGGAGNWSDPLHWSLISGGTPNIAGCIPSSTNNVYFDANSGFTSSSNSITVDVATAFCKNFDWTGAPNFPSFTASNSNNNLNIGGSLTLIPGMSWNFSGAIYFTSSTTGQTITTAGQKLLSNVYFNSTGGEWILQDDFEMAMYSYLYHEYGTLNTNGKSLTTYCYYSSSSNPRSLILGSSVVSILSYSSDAFYLRLDNMVIDAGTSLISFTATDYEPGFYLNSGSAPVTFHNVEFVGSSNTGKINNNTYNEVTFNEVSFAGHGTINGNNKYNGNLTFAGGKTYTLQANKTQTLIGDFIANGTCGNEVIIKSSSTTQATLSKSSDSVTINYANLQNINATGGAIFTANGSIDGGGVTGWAITPPASSGADMYWIGGAGNWSDPLHWSLTSGGTPNIAGCIPSSTNNVYFDANSGFTSSSNSVTVDVATAFCKNFDWTGAPNFPSFTASNSNNNLNVGGSLTLIPGMSWNFSGVIYFTSSSAGQTITTAGQKLLSNVYFNSAGGEWILQDDFEMAMYSYLYHEYGTLNTNGKSLTTYCYYSSSSNPRSLILGSSVVSILSYSSDAFYVRLNNMVIDAGTSLISFTATDYEPGFYLNSGSGPVTFHNVEFVGSSNTGKINNNTYNEATFNNVSFAGHGTINGNNKYNGNLTFTGGKTYTLQANSTQTLGGNFIANGSVGQLVDIKSSSTSAAYFSKTGGCVIGKYLQLQNIHGIGTAEYYAEPNSVDLGNNTGWSFSTAPCQIVDADVTISSDAGNIICNGTNVTFTATPINGGASPAYQWQINGVNAGTNSSVFSTSSLNDNDVVTCILTSSCACVTNNPATSNAITLSVNSSLPVSVNITSDAGTNICTSTNVTFTANVTNGGSNPTYQWFINGNAYGSNSPTFTNSSWNNSDQVHCIATSNLGACVTGNPATSNTLVMNASTSLPLSVSISANTGTTISAGTFVTFTASAVNAGPNPAYQWYVNGSPVGSNSNTYSSYSLLNADEVSCTVSSNLGGCVTNNPANSNVLTMSVSGIFTYYWIGGSGNWSDGSHWALISGGTPVNLVPGTQNNVRFDANSGFISSSKTVTVDVSVASCADMNWTGSANAPIFNSTSSNNNLKIYGSLTLIPQMTWNFTGSIYFEATTTGHTITSAGKTFLREIHFNGSGGEWTLQDMLKTNNDYYNTIYHNYGSLKTNDQTIMAYSFISSTDNVRSLDLGNSLMILSTYYSNFVSLNFTNLTFNPGTAIIRSSPIYNYNDTKYLNLQGMSSTPINMCNVEFSGVDGISYISNQVHDNMYSSQTINFKDVSFAGDGNIEGNNTFENLSFNKGHIYTLQSSRTQTINNTLTAVGGCGNDVVIKSSSNGTQAILRKTSGSISLNYVTLQDNKAEGGATFTANNSTDNGNNTGWTITPLSTNNLSYYWIGGTGNWSDANHWSLTSGGVPNQNGCIPNSTNDAIFDANSGFISSSKTVTVDLSVASCADMNWTGSVNAPIFNSTSNNNNLKIYGSLTLIPQMTWNFTGSIYFEATTTGHTITSAGKTFLREIHFNGSGGEWTLQDMLKTNNDYYNTIYHNYGSLKTNDQTIMAYSFISSTNNVRSLDLGNSLMILSNYIGDVFYLNVSNLTFNPGTAIIRSSPIYNYNDTKYLNLQGMSSTPINMCNVEFSGVDGISYISNQVHDNMYSSQTINFKDVSFAGDGNIEGNNTFENLSFNKGHIYTLQSSRTQTINNTLTAVGGCGNDVVIKSSSNGTQAILRKTSGSISLNYVTLQDNKAEGGATFTANNSTDNGNNTGWTITPLSTNNLSYYWIGGTGNWSDANHWSLTSGGVPNQNGCIPNSTNDAIFDANSGFISSSKTVTVDLSVASCADMNWTGSANAPIFNSTSNNNNLKIYGSLTLIPQMTWNFTGSIYFEATTTGHTITSAGKTFLREIHFNGSGGEWTLQDMLKTNNDYYNTIYHNYGSLKTNDQTIMAYSFISSTDNVRSLDLGNSLMILSTYYSNFVSLNFTNLTFNPGTAIIRSSPIYNYNDTKYLNLQGMSSTPINMCNVEFSGVDGISYISNQVHDNMYSSQTINFKDVSFAGDGNIEGNNTFENLSFNKGHIYTLQSSRTQTINNTFNAVGASGQLIDMRSSSSGTQANIYKTTGCVAGDYLQLQDMNASGGATFYAGPLSRSIDLGNNTGWTWSLGTYPVVSSQNLNDTVCEGSDAVFSVTASGSVMTYLWHVSSDSGNTWQPLVDDIVYNGSTTNTLTINNVSMNFNNYQYYCNIENNCITTSVPAQLFVMPNLSTPDTILGPVSTCIGIGTINYSINPISSATSYTWTVPSNATIISGQGTTDIEVAFSSTTSGNISVYASNPCFDSQATDLTITVYTSNVWLGHTSNWSDINNWSCSILPDNSNDGTIPSSPLGGNFPIINTTGNQIKNLIIEPSAQITVSSGSDLSIYGDITNNGLANFGLGEIIFSGTTQSVNGTISVGDLTINMGSYVTLLSSNNEISGILLCNGVLYTNDNLILLSTASSTALIDGANYGNIYGSLTQQRFVPSAKTKGYKHFSTAFKNTKVGEFSNFMLLNLGDQYATPYPTLFKFSESAATSYFSQGWVQAAAQGQVNTPLDIGVGYTAQFGSGSTNDVTAYFKGLINDGDVSVNLTANNIGSAKGNGWNLLGNPYPSPIDLSLLPYSSANINKSVSVYISTSMYNGYYGYYNAMLNLPLNGGSRYIGALHAFFVQCNNPNGGTLTFTNSMRKNITNISLYKDYELPELPLVKLIGSLSESNSLFDETAVLFSDLATNDFDADYDISKIMNTEPSIPNLYSLSSKGETYAMNVLSEELSEEVLIPLGFEIKNSNAYLIEATEIQNLPYGYSVYLEDKKLNKIIDLSLTPKYYFTMQSNEASQGRFYLKFSNSFNTNVTETNVYENDFLVWSYNNTVNIMVKGLNEKQANILIFDALGKQVLNESIYGDGTHSFNMQVAKGIYIVNYNDGNITKQAKLFIAE